MRQKGFAAILIVIIIALAAVAGAYYYGAKKGNIISTPTEIPSFVATNSPNQVTPTLKPTADPTANWKTFTTKDNKVSFKYPSDWVVEQNTSSEGWGKEITTANLKNDKFRLNVSVANAFMNECMQEGTKQNITISEVTFVKRYFKGIVLEGNEACTNKGNLENLEIWLQPTIINKEP